MDLSSLTKKLPTIVDDDSDNEYEKQNISGDEDDDEIEDDDDDIDPEEDEEHMLKTQEDVKNITSIFKDDEDDDEDDDDESYLQKFNHDINKKYLIDIHPECVKHNDTEIQTLSIVVRDENNIIIDDLHRTIPYLTKYEKTRILGVRTKQINSGAPIFVEDDPSILDGYLIAEKELMERKIPFIIRRPIPGGGSEYWKLSDLDII
jgi:DNA-directed RNA polymerase I, II, and III subunit RPABC2